MPPSPPTPSTPSNSLVIRHRPGPISPFKVPPMPSTPTRTPKTHKVSVQVKAERDTSASTAIVPRRIDLPPTPTSRAPNVIRRSRTITPSPRRRSSVTPIRTKIPCLSSSAGFQAKLAAIRSRDTTRRNKTPISGPNSYSNRGRLPTLPADGDEEEVRFWMQDQRQGSSSEAAIEIDDNDDDDADHPSPSDALIHQNQFPPFHSVSGIHDNDLDREGSEFSTASLRSAATPFSRAPTLDFRDVRYGRTYPQGEGRIRNGSNAVSPPANSTAALCSIPVALAGSISKISELIRTLIAKNIEDSKAPLMNDSDKLNLVHIAIFRGETDKYRAILSSIQKDLQEGGDVEVPKECISTILSLLKTSLLQAIKTDFLEYRSPAYRGSMEVRKSTWYADFKNYIKFSMQMLPNDLQKEKAEDIILSFRAVTSDRTHTNDTIITLSESFDGVNVVTVRKLAEAIIDFFAATINVAWSR
ncbi:uncharacterized protein IL334_007045 [Kwoniella shivajii]|uniref:Uncharacterized protein n=1 Tax=Kwoniella shivajii TaxID=564305 RepID=A0ABZ1D8C4_9TREE|nr:hypothetical protein IL334_007045 [Kwoniella shivajii]